MDRDEMLLRHGIYCGRAIRDLGDFTYFNRWFGKAHLLTETEFCQEASEIHARLSAAGKIRPDEDPYDECVSF